MLFKIAWTICNILEELSTVDIYYRQKFPAKRQKRKAAYSSNKLRQQLFIDWRGGCTAPFFFFSLET